MNNATYSSNPRIAMVKKTGELYLVAQRDLDARKVHCWGNVLAFKGQQAKHAAARSFDEGAVEIRTIHVVDQHLLVTLFEQTRKTEEMQQLLFSGEKEVHLKKDGSEGKFKNPPKSAIAHESHRCPCHEVSMRQRRGPKGGFFFACPSRSETGCNITVALDGKWSDPDGQCPDRIENGVLVT